MTMPDDHPSIARLLESARLATLISSSPITDYAGVGRALDVSSAVITNWKARGVSKDGAIKAAKQWHCTVAWILDGERSPEGRMNEDAPVLSKSTLAELRSSLDLLDAGDMIKYALLAEIDRLTAALEKANEAARIARPVAMETNSERRLRKLKVLCEAHGAADVAEKAELSLDYLKQILAGVKLPAKGDNSRSERALGDTSARAIEEAYGLGRGWFDNG